MSMTDPIADMLTRIRNAVSARHDIVEIPASKNKEAIAKVLKEEGFIDSYVVSGDAKKVLTIVLRYGPSKEKIINGLKRISKPGLRVYVEVKDIPRVLNGLGIAILSTSQGIMTDKSARAKNTGGEVLAYVW